MIGVARFLLQQVDRDGSTEYGSAKCEVASATSDRLRSGAGLASAKATQKRSAEAIKTRRATPTDRQGGSEARNIVTT